MSSIAVQSNPMTESFLAMGSILDDPRDIYFGFQLRIQGRAVRLRTLRSEIDRQLKALPALTHVPIRRDGHTLWEPSPDFDLEAHVHTGPALPATGILPAAELLPASPDHRRPPWRMWLLPGSGDDWGVCYLAHHALQDATGMLDTLTTLFGAAPPSASGIVPQPGTLAALAAFPSLFAGYRLGSGWAPTGARGAGRRVASVDVPIDTLRTVARAFGATVNQVYLAALTVALRDWAPAQWTEQVPHRQYGGLSVLMPID